jgi:hypothetical protein
MTGTVTLDTTLSTRTVEMMAGTMTMVVGSGKGADAFAPTALAVPVPLASPTEAAVA